MKKIFCILLFIFAGPAFADETIGVITYTEGMVKLNAKDVKENQKVHMGDTIEAGENSKAQIMLVDNNVIHVNASSKINLKEFEFNEQTDKKWSLIELFYGSIRSLVNQRYPKDEQGYQIQTPSAVAGVRGTDFLVEHAENEQKTEVTSFSGVVNQGERGAGRLIRNGINIPPGHFMQLIKGHRAFEAAQKQEEKKLASLREATQYKINMSHKVFRQVLVERRERIRKSQENGMQKFREKQMEQQRNHRRGR